MANDDSNLRPARAQLAEPPYADPLVRWCGRGEQVTAPPIPIIDSNEGSLVADDGNLSLWNFEANQTVVVVEQEQDFEIGRRDLKPFVGLAISLG